jgi:hypothetical protein
VVITVAGPNRPTTLAPPSGTLAELEKAAWRLLDSCNRWVAATEGDGPVGEEGYTLSLEYEEDSQLLSAAAHAHAEAGESASLAALLSLAHAAGRAEERREIIISLRLGAHLRRVDGSHAARDFADALALAANYIEHSDPRLAGGKEGGE